MTQQLWTLVARWCAVAIVLVAACNRDQATTPPTADVGAEGTDPTPKAVEPPQVDAAAIRRHVEFLAADAQGGRLPGSAEDGRVQDYLIEQMKQAGFEPGFGSAYRQKFTVTDGVLPKDPGGSMLDVSGLAIPHSLVPYTTDTSSSGPAVTKLVFVGYGLALEGKGTGDYKGLQKRVNGKIVVALHGAPTDVSLTAAETRPQSKVIVARDHGAAGFVLWDPTASTPLPNHGTVSDLGIPVLFVGANGNTQMVEAFTGRVGVAEVELAKLPIRHGSTTKKVGTMQTNVSTRTIETANIAGVVPGNGSSDKVVVIGAHMDHLGMGTASSLSPDEKAVHNGADDNASGVAVMLELCGALTRLDPAKRPYDVMCMAFGAEEMGLLGSKHFVKNLGPQLEPRLMTMVNFDMVGRLRDDTVMVAGVGTSSVWPDLVEDQRGSLKITATEDGYGPSDHGSFYEAGLPVLHFFTGPHEDYHKPSDDIDKIDFDGSKRVADMALGIVQAVLADAVVPDYKETERKSPRGGARQQFRVSLGTIPDYAAQVDGVRLSGVRKGGAADKGGLTKGDVIKKIGDREIHNFDEFMAMFGVLEAGKTVTFVVERDGVTLELQVTPAAPRPR